MKKILMLIALLGGFAACSDGEKNETPAPAPADKLLFTGRVEATPDEGSRFEAFAEEGIDMELQEAGEGLYHLLMPEIKFVPQMPWLSIEVRGLEDTAQGEAIRFEVAETIPYFMGAPYDSFPIANLRGEYNPSTRSLVVDFDCNTMQVHFAGTK